MDGDLQEFPLPTTGGMPSMITTGPDGALWFTLNQANSIGRIGLDGQLAIQPLATDSSGPVGIHAGTRGLWFAEILTSQIGHITTDGLITEFPLPNSGARPHAVLADSSGAGCWVTQWGTSALAHVGATGEVHQFALPAGSEPHGLTRGPDGALWIALETGHLFRFVPAAHLK